ncbi:bifunctional 4-hydroxy-2-oxoglutarate aldolase/2-dehydro-3-deoxy-phosphogluconate aldolase [Mycobacterium sp. URHB0044]|uniref:bifunctional 4-hydroxy-2-oxoglutarate aldolase/2-dehydro-3-deoxy-phosphogluconate aldolase n=1 Tax=Mycobacterium sp. URHB0044 TaxID=1380386 RepID=UPI00048E190B
MTPVVIAVLRAADARRYAPVVDVLADNGIRGIELTMSTPGTLDVLADIRAGIPDEVQVGIGTVTTVAQLNEALGVGVDFVVTPTTDVAVIDAAVTAGVPIYPGGLTPTELWKGWAAGATAVKVFPAALVGPDYVAHLRGPFPDIEVIPSGGVGMAEAVEWIRAGACAVSVGGPLIGDALSGGDLDALARRCRKLNDTVAAAEAHR